MSIPRTITRARRAVTLVEAVASIVVIAVVSAAVLPLVTGTSDSYASAATTRRAAERGAYAMERMIRLLRDAPPTTVPGELGIAIATPTTLRYTDGRGLELTGDTLYLRDTDSSLSVLCREVDAMSIDYLGADGVTDTMSVPADTQRFNVTLRTAGFELRSAALARVKVMEP
jgi:type II secretory pathway pseudopilin PulG